MKKLEEIQATNMKMNNLEIHQKQLNRASYGGENIIFMCFFLKKDSDVHFHTMKTIAAATVISRIVVFIVILRRVYSE